jgi:hypothetical protein
VTSELYDGIIKYGLSTILTVITQCAINTSLWTVVWWRLYARAAPMVIHELTINILFHVLMKQRKETSFSSRASLMHTFKDYVRMLHGDIYSS